MSSKLWEVQDAEQASKLIDHISLLKGHGLGEKAASELIEFFAGFDEDKMFYTHWMDVIYYGLMFWGEKIRVDLAKKINDLMIEREQGGREVHIISHSLGTSVLHDTLAKLYRKDTDITSKIPQLDTDRFQINSLWMVANVSRLVNLLNDIADPNHSIVSSDNGGCTDLMFNVRNEFDPFTWIKEYNRPIESGGRHIKVKTVRQVNTHDLKEYVEAPEVADAFFSNVLDIVVSDEQYEQGVNLHALSSINYNYDELKEAFHDLQNQSGVTGKVQAIKELVNTADAFQKKLKDMIEQ